MLYTLADARTKMAQFVGTGTSNVVFIDQKINDALERLLDGHDWSCLRRQVRIQCVGNTFSLPYNAEKILWCDIDGYPTSVFGSGYQYVSSGPGDLDYRTTGSLFKYLTDLGDGWPTQYEVPKSFLTSAGVEVTDGEFALAAFSSASGEVGKSITISGSDADGEELLSGEPIPIQDWGTVAPGTWDEAFVYSTFKFSSISRVVKDVTSGHVSLYAVYPTTGQMFLLAKYHPSQTIPQFRRFRIVNATLGTDGTQSARADFNTAQPASYTTSATTATGTMSSVLAVVRLRHVPLTDPADILPIDSLQALRLAVMAISAEDQKDFTFARATWADALAAMTGREAASQNTKGTPTVIDTGYNLSLGRRMNRGVLL